MVKDGGKSKKKAKRMCNLQSNEAVGESEAYVAGDVSSSLFPKKASESATHLSSLFDTKGPAVQPVYVPVKIPKRKLPEAEGADVKKACKETVVKAKVTKEKELSVSEKKLADREQSLANADEEETRKNVISKEKLKSKKNQSLDDDGVVVQPRKRKVNRAEERIKNKRTVFVGNLPADYTKQMLKSLFKEFGHIESMRFRSVARAEANLSRKVAAIQRKVHPKRKNINAYIVFKDESSASQALKRNGAEVGSGFHIRVDIASKRSSHDNKRSAFIGNLPYEIEEEAVRDHFSECGKVQGVRIIRDQKTGIGKGFGYVLFESADAVQLALKLNNSELSGRKIRVKRSLTAEAAQKSTNKSSDFKKKLDTLKQAKPLKGNSFVGETAEVGKAKNKGHKNKKKKTVGNKKKKNKD
ncbi:hypothetical protein XENTR_v10003650 [Xenopus tropicalis]|uniref:RNA-binding protein 34 n=1 Tax=Xenopus tropicalis TaxID=8364 RepID=F7E5Z9_XENTR|nr:hypothetical protein XENTR_v10003650 [Xenopus tropicalis]